jgi:hypothetical protein
VLLRSDNSLEASGVAALVPKLAGLARLDFVDLRFAPRQAVHGDCWAGIANMPRFENAFDTGFASIE